MADGISENEAIRYRRLAYYADDIARFNEALSSFVKKASARCALLIDRDGHTVAVQGFLQGLDTTSLAALVAGSFASTREVARLLGESQFDVLFHQGQDQNIHVRLVGERTLQVAVFDSQAKPGMVQVMTKELSAKVDAIIVDIASKPEPDGEEATIGEGFSQEMKQHLDDLFGGL